MAAKDAAKEAQAAKAAKANAEATNPTPDPASQAGEAQASAANPTNKTPDQSDSAEVAAEKAQAEADSLRKAANIARDAYKDAERRANAAQSRATRLASVAVHGRAEPEIIDMLKVQSDIRRRIMLEQAKAEAEAVINRVSELNKNTPKAGA